MLKNISSIVRYLIFWYLIFAAARCVFIILNWNQAVSAGFTSVFASFVHGFRLDLSMCCYLTAVPVLLWTISHYLERKTMINRILKGYNGILLAIIIVITVADGELYQHWGQKLNSYASSFARFPKEMLVFSAGGYLFKFVLIIAGFIAFAWFIYTKGMKGLDETDGTVAKWKPPVAAVCMLGVLFLGIRGGWGKAAINQSSAFYSSDIFLNHTAINTTWNFLASLVESSEETKSNPYNFTEEAAALSMLGPLQYKPSGRSQLFSDTAPNIVLVILEGWTADVIGALGGEPDVTPELNALCSQGLLFDQFYANGNRTDKGLAAIISSQPALAKSSIINNIQKFTSLPSIPSVLKSRNYQTSFYYGGASEFANMKGYWLSAGYDHIVDLGAFPLSSRNAEWGVHDDVLWGRVLEELNKADQTTPFFATVLTLSSHEPFAVPHRSRFNGKNDADLYRNSVNFADKALGAFMKQAQQQPWYKHTVFVIMADHGHQWPQNRRSFDPERFRIPMLLVGGALKPKDAVDHTIGSQVDLAATLLGQFGYSAVQFKWSNDLMDTAYRSNPYATYTYNDGIGMIRPGAKIVFDQESRQMIWNEGDSTLWKPMQDQARAYEQVYFEEFRNR